MKITSGFLCFVLLANTAVSQRSVEMKFSRLVSQERLLKTVRELVGFGNRQGGTPSGDKSAAFVRNEFKRLGLKTQVVEDPERLVFVNRRWSINVETPARLRGIFSHAWLGGFSPTVKQKVVRLVEIRPGDEITKSAVDSAAVLTPLENASRYYKDLADKGAACILTWAEPHSRAYLTSAFIENLPPDLQNQIPLFDISRNCANSLTKSLHRKEAIRLRFFTDTQIQKGRSKTVIATLPGKSKKYFIVCAHGDSDSGGPGADDNASGDAGVLELARTLTTLRRNGVLPMPDSGIKFVIWGSEYASSENYVRTNSTNLEDILGVVNFDEIGTGATRNCLYFEGNDQRVNEPLLKVFQKVGEDYVGKKAFWHEATTNPSQGGTDSYVFLPNYLSRLGVPMAEIPSVTVYTAAWQEPKVLFQPREWRTTAWKGLRDSVSIDYSLYYHSSLDIPSMTTEKEPFNMVWGVKAVGIALLRLLW